MSSTIEAAPNNQMHVLNDSSYENIDTRLAEILQQELDTDDQQQFVLHFQMYLTYGRDDKQFVVDLDNVWQWIGFTRRDNAKRFLYKVFEKDVDFIVSNLLLPKEKQPVHGGHNKESIKMNVSTFKAFCMTANTERGKTTRKYYSRMENIFFKYCEDQHKTVIKNMEIDNQAHRLINNHEILLRAHKRTPVVYMMLVKCPFIEEGRKLIKIGCTDDIHDRILKLRSHFGCDVYALHIFPCEDNRAFEKFLFSHHKIAPLKYNKLVGPKQSVSTECFLLKDDNTLECVKRVLQKHVLFYKTRNIEAKKLQLQLNCEENESHRLQLHRDLLNQFAGNPEGYLQALQLMQTPHTIDVLSTSPCSTLNANDSKTNTVEQTYDNNICSKPQGPQVQLYDGFDITRLVKVYNGITDATREVKNSSFTAIKFAATHKLLYLGYRWHFIDRHDEHPYMVRDIGQTVDKVVRRTGFVAMLDLEKQSVEKVFPNQKHASEHISQHVSAMSSAIKYNKSLSGHCWMYWEDISDALQKEYLELNHLPSHDVKLRGVAIEQIDPDTITVVKVYPSIMDVVKEYKMSPKTVKQAVLQEKTYKGFIWRLQNTST
jgi:hypothetical protein